jgi:hypothetical protein
MTDLASLIETRVQKRIDQCILSALQDFVASCDQNIRVGDLAKDCAANFVEQMEARLTKPVAKSTDSKSAWLGYAKQYRLEHDKPSPKDVGDAWKIAKPNLSKKEFDDFVVLGQTKSKPKSKSSASPSAWIGYRSEWAEKNNALPEGHPDRKTKRDISTFAAKDWKHGEGFSDEQKAAYHKLAEDNKQAKLDAKTASEKASEEKKAAATTEKVVETEDETKDETKDDETIEV